MQKKYEEYERTFWDVVKKVGGFVSCPYSFPQHCMSYRLSVGAGLFINPFLD
jgi:hypothetical protein